MRPNFLLLILASCVLGQEAPKQEPRDERVQVLLRNGHSLIGVAKAGVRCERLVRGNFKPSSDPTERASGIRVWYYQDLDGYIFLESRQLDRVDVLGTLTPDESRTLSDAVAAAHGTRTYRAAASRPSRRDDGSGSRPAPVEVLGLTTEERALLDRFPPDRGWSPEKFGELQRRKIVLHVSPTSEERAFIEEFPTFQGAWKKWLATQPSGSGATDDDSDSPKHDRNR